MNDGRKLENFEKIGKNWKKPIEKTRKNSTTVHRKCVLNFLELSKRERERAKKLPSFDFPKGFLSKFRVMSHLEGTSVASRNGLLGAKTFTGEQRI